MAERAEVKVVEIPHQVAKKIRVEVETRRVDLELLPRMVSPGRVVLFATEGHGTVWVKFGEEHNPRIRIVFKCDDMELVPATEQLAGKRAGFAFSREFEIYAVNESGERALLPAIVLRGRVERVTAEIED